MVKNKIIHFFCNFFASFYWAYLKPSIDNYVINHQRKKFAYFGNKVVFKGGGTIFHPEFISIGDFVQIGDNYFLMGIGGIEIGDGTIISRNVCIHSGNHNFKSSTMMPFDENYSLKKIKIGKGVWIGQNVNILPGIFIGDGAIIAMGTTVSKDVLPYTIVASSTQKEIGIRDVTNSEMLIKSKKYFGQDL